MSSLWTEEEINILMNNPHLNSVELSVLLPFRTPDSIAQKRKKLDLVYRGKKWSDVEIEILKNNTYTDEELIQLLSGRTLSSIINKKSELGIITYVSCEHCGSTMQKIGSHNTCKICAKNYNNRTKNNLSRRYSTYKNSAKRRGHDFQLSMEEFSTFQDEPCYYCGDEIQSSGKIGIDRIDNTKGYIIENCVPCCEICNKMKLTLDLNTWLLKINKISRKHPYEISK